VIVSIAARAPRLALAFVFLCAGFVSTARPLPALADFTCGAPYSTYYGPAKLCTAGIPSSLLAVTAYDQQQASEWCWAASISGIFAYYGHPVRQQEIVQQAYGGIANMPGTPQAIMQSLNRQWTDANGNQFTVVASGNTGTWVTAAQDLANNEPLIIAEQVGGGGHAMIMTATTYVLFQNGSGVTQSVVVRDPSPFNPQMRLLSPQELASVTWLVRIRVQP
jgi:hypothetical protein